MLWDKVVSDESWTNSSIETHWSFSSRILLQWEQIGIIFFTNLIFALLCDLRSDEIRRGSSLKESETINKPTEIEKPIIPGINFESPNE